MLHSLYIKLAGEAPEIARVRADVEYLIELGIRDQILIFVHCNFEESQLNLKL